MALNDAMDRVRVRLAVERSVSTDETQFFYDKVVRRGGLLVRTCRSKASLGCHTPKNNALNTILFLLEQGSLRLRALVCLVSNMMVSRISGRSNKQRSSKRSSSNSLNTFTNRHRNALDLTPLKGVLSEVASSCTRAWYAIATGTGYTNATSGSGS